MNDWITTLGQLVETVVRAATEAPPSSGSATQRYDAQGNLLPYSSIPIQNSPGGYPLSGPPQTAPQGGYPPGGYPLSGPPPQQVDPNIAAGQELARRLQQQIPPPAPAPGATPSSLGTYTVQQGETLSGIAARLRVSLGALEASNPQLERGQRWNLLYVGDVVRVPSAASGQTYTTPPASQPILPPPVQQAPPQQTYPGGQQAPYGAYPQGYQGVPPQQPPSQGGSIIGSLFSSLGGLFTSSATAPRPQARTTAPPAEEGGSYTRGSQGASVFYNDDGSVKSLYDIGGNPVSPDDVNYADVLAEAEGAA